MTSHSTEMRGDTRAPTRWRVRPAITGRGPILIGPDPHVDGPGALVYAPPDVLLRTAADGPPLDRDGWRKARWRPDERGRVLIDQARPLASMQTSLAEVVEDVALFCPEHLPWVADVVERQLRLLLGQIRGRDHAGRLRKPDPALLDLLLLSRIEADGAFRRAAELLGEHAPFLRPGYFSDLVFGGYLAHQRGRREVERLETGMAAPPPRHSTLRPRFRDDESDRPRPRSLD